MKKIFGFFIIVMTMLSVASCSKEDNEENLIWDIAPTSVRIYLVDEEGNNLLDPEVEGNWVGEEMQVNFKDNDFSAIWNEEELHPGSRAILAVFYGLLWNGAFNNVDNGDYYFRFGNFSGDSSHKMNLTFSISGIDTEYDFEYVYNLNWVNNKPDSYKYIIYNGEKNEGNKIVLTVPRSTNN